MADDSLAYLFRWSGITMGLDPKKERIIHNDSKVLVIGKENIPHSMIAFFDFEPSDLSVDLQEKIKQTTSVTICAVGIHPSTEYFPIPEWIKNHKKLQGLLLRNADLVTISFIENLPIVFLTILNAKPDSDELLNTLRTLKKLEMFIYDNSISSDYILKLKKELPKVRFEFKE